MKKLPKGFDFTEGTVITLVLEDWQQLTGTFIGIYDDDTKPYPGSKPKSHTRLTIDVEMEESLEYIVLQLAEPAGIVSFTSATPLVSGLVVTGVDLGITSTTFAAGTLVSVRLDKIIFALRGGTGTGSQFPILL